MSHTIPTTASFSSNFQIIFNTALEEYKKTTKNDLLTHQLTATLKTCESAAAILEVLNDLQELMRSQADGQSSKQWLNATVTVLCAFSDAIGEGVGLVIF